jgi:nicotinate-nucleotide adenylyltransferase
MAKIERIGILGGAFNPPHKGHLILANKALKKLNLDRIIFIPAGIPPLKKRDLAKAEARYEMTKLLIKRKPKFSLLDYEIKKAKKGEKAYTIETIRYLKRKFKNCKIFWIVGEDSLREIIEEKWKGKLKVLNEAQFVVVSRPHHKFILKGLSKKFEKNKKEALKKVIKIKLNIPISATEIREKIKKGEKVNKFLPKKVLKYIREKKLYV